MIQRDLNAQIVGEIYAAMERLDADEELLAIIGSWRGGVRPHGSH